MTNESQSAETGTDTGIPTGRPTRLAWWRELFAEGTTETETGRNRVPAGAGLAALLVVAAAVAVDVLANLPFEPVAVPPAVRAFLGVGVPVVLALCLIAVAVSTRRTPLRVGLLFVGVFGLLPLAARAATVPALFGVILGGGVALVGTNGVPADYRTLRRHLIATGVLAGVAVTLSGSIGLLDGSARGIGGLLTFGAVTGMVVRADGDRLALAAGLFAVAVVAAASVMHPYVLGSALLVAFAVAGVPHVIVAAAVGGAAAATVAGLRRDEYTLAIGAPLVLLAGVPATFPRAMAVVLGAMLVLVPFDAAPGATEPATAGVGP